MPKVGDRGTRWGGGSKGECGSGDARGREVLGTRHGKGQGLIKRGDVRLGVPDKGGNRKVNEEGGTGLSKDGGRGNSGEQLGEPGERGCSQRASEPQGPSEPRMGRPPAAARRARGESGARGGGERRSELRVWCVEVSMRAREPPPGAARRARPPSGRRPGLSRERRGEGDSTECSPERVSMARMAQFWSG